MEEEAKHTGNVMAFAFVIIERERERERESCVSVHASCVDRPL